MPITHNLLLLFDAAAYHPIYNFQLNNINYYSFVILIKLPFASLSLGFFFASLLRPVLLPLLECVLLLICSSSSRTVSVLSCNFIAFCSRLMPFNYFRVFCFSC